MRVGFTGTKIGMKSIQREKFVNLIQTLNPERFHHGSCIGCDYEAGKIVLEKCPNCIVVLHPPTTRTYEAKCFAHITKPRRPFIDRDHDIVDEVDVLVAIPKGDLEELRSGTWATVRYARKKHKPIYIIYPSDDMVIENERLSF